MLLPARTPSRYASALAALSVFMAALLLPLSFTGGVMTTRDTAVAGRLSRCAVVADQWLYVDLRQLFAGRRGDGGCHRQKTYFYRRRRAVLPEQPAVLSDAQSLPVRRVEGAAGPGRGDDFSQRQCGAGPAYDGAQRTRAFSILGTVFGIGLAFGPLLIGFMIDAVGWRGVYALFALLSAGVLLIGLVSLPATEKASRGHPTTWA